MGYHTNQIPILHYNQAAIERFSSGNPPFLNHFHTTKSSIMSRRGLTIAGLALAGGAGYYLYSAGGDPKVAQKKMEADAHKLSERSTKLLLKPKPNSPKPKPEQRKWAKRRVLKSTVPLTSLTRRWKTRQPKQRAESAAGLAANRSKCSDCLGVGAGAISSVHCFQRVFPIEAALNLKQHSISRLVEIHNALK